MKLISQRFRQKTEVALQLFRKEYAEQHQTRLNRRLHLYGRVLRIISVFCFFLYDVALGLILFLAGYLIQFLGHAIEGTSPSFFRNPYHLFLGTLNHLVRIFDSSHENVSSKRERSGLGLRKIRSPFSFSRWVVPRDGRSLRLYLTLLQLLFSGRGSIYSRFKLLKASHAPLSYRKFLIAIGSLEIPHPSGAESAAPARLFARLLRSIYLTEVLPLKNEKARAAGPNEGYSNHPHFGVESEKKICADTEDRQASLPSSLA